MNDALTDVWENRGGGEAECVLHGRGVSLFATRKRTIVRFPIRPSPRFLDEPQSAQRNTEGFLAGINPRCLSVALCGSCDQQLRRSVPPSLRRSVSPFLLLALLLPVVAAHAQTATVRGFVTDAADDQPLTGVNVVLEGDTGLLGAATDADGFYQVSRIPPGTYVVRATFIGYEPFVDTLALGAADLVTLNIALEPARQELEEIVVETEGGAATVAAGLQSVRPGDLARVPTPTVGGDLAGYLQTLPGIVALGDRGGQLFVRGGTPVQNLVLMDGMLIYQPFHILGFFSAFPEDLVAYADVYAGGFGAQYTGRISSVIDVAMRNGNKQRFAGSVSAAPFMSSVRFEGPIAPGRVSFLVSVRESVVEHAAPVLVGLDLPFRFGDRFAKVHAEIGRNSQLSLVAMQTHDRGFIDPEQEDDTGDAVRWENSVYGLRYLILPRQFPILAEFILSTSAVENTVGGTVRPERMSRARRVNTEANVVHYLGSTRMQWGLFARTLLLEYVFGGLFQYLDFDDVSRVEAGLYLDADVALGEALRLNTGVAVVSYPESFDVSIEPRLRATWRPGGTTGRHQLSGALGYYHQALTGVTDERDAGSTFVAWLPPEDGLPTASALHAIAGWQVDAGAGVRLAAEGYYKRLQDLSVPAWSALARFTTRLETADGAAYGVDARVEYQRRRFYGYIGYALSWVEYEAAQENFGIWFGEPVQRYHPPHDRRHQLNALASLDLGLFEANVRWQLGSGLPFTRPLGFDEWVPMRGLVDVRTAPGATRLLYNRPYAARLPAYHRLDVSLDRAFGMPWGRITLQGGIINVYDRTNLFYYDLFTARRVDQLPLMPFFGLNVEVN